VVGCLVAGATLTLILAGIATIAGFFGRSHWRMELLGHFRVQYFWALTAAGAVLLLKRRRFRGILAGLLAIVNLSLIAPLYFGSDALAGATPQLKLLSLNVHFLNRDFQPTLDLIADEQPDVILLLEITPDWAESLRPLDTLYPHSHVIPSHRTDGMALFSRYPIAKLDIERCPGINLPTLIAELDLPAGRVTVVGTHPASPGTAGLFEARNIQLAMVADWVAERSGPVVLIGDMNITSWSPYFRDLVSASGLRDTRYGYGVEPTWPWFPLPLRIPIDHCLVSPHLGVVTRRVGPDVGSDHRPIVIELVY
jgi:endonuclease/exonuclease/phosphatase (EEP) superfamily protein YafD